MKHLPLYTDKRAAVEKCTPLGERDEKCTRCKLSAGARTVCAGADAQGLGDGKSVEGAILVIGDVMSQAEDASARPVSNGPNSVLRDLLSELRDRPVVYATAIRCAPGQTKVKERHGEACRPFTAGLIAEVKPSRILCFGKWAYHAVLGSKPDSIQLGRRAYGYLSDGTPVFMFNSARRVTPNKFLYARWRKDIEWALTAEPELPPWDGVIQMVETVEDAEEAAAALSVGFTFDTEYAGLKGSDYFQVVCLTATPNDDLSVSYLWGEEALLDPNLTEPLVRVLADETILKNGHNLKVDFEAVAYGLGMRDERGVLTVQGVGGDSMLWMRTIDTETKSKLEIADHHVGMGGHKAENDSALAAAITMVNKARDNPKQLRLDGFTHRALKASVEHPLVGQKAFAYALIPRDILYRYCALDTVATARLVKKFRPMVEGTPNLALVSKECHLAPTAACAQIESWGMSADIETAKTFGKMLTPRRDSCLREIRRLGCDVDITSPQQLSQYLFNDLGLPVQEISEKSKQPRTNKPSLEKLVDHHPVVPLLLEHAKLQKLLSTYVDGLIPHIRPDGRIRSSLNIVGARSGRMSSSEPNLQNIPSTGEFAKVAKSIFNVPPGHVLLQLDYSQLEVRIAAMLSQEPGLIQAYIDGADVHRRTASKAFKTPEEEVTKELRRNAKAVVFGVLYGKTANSLARDLGVSQNEGRTIFDSVLGAYPVMTQWMKECRRYTEKYGTAWTYIPSEDGKMRRARCRQLWQIAEPDGGAQSTARNGAVNTPVQGSASDYMLRTLVAVVNWIISDGIPARVTNTVHDSILLEVPYAWALEVAAVVKDIMEAWPSCGVPLVADVDIGLSWGSLHKLEGLTLVAHGRRNGLTDDEIIRVCEADKDLRDEMGDDQQAWLARVSDLAQKVAA